MKISENWLREWVNPQVTTEQLAHQLTMAGLEVDSVQKLEAGFTNVVVGEILECEQHPDADKLRVCKVTDGVEEFQVVCGAPNARSGLKVPFAKVGAHLGEGFKIKKAKLRGVESQGMLCARSELGVDGDSSGIWELAADAPTGEMFDNYWRFDDQIIEVDLTPNRADCLSIRGIAREVSVLNQSAITEPSIEIVATSTDDSRSIALSAGEACPRYIGRVIKDIDMRASTPAWMQEKLEKSDIRSIDPIVDITNYVLIELGQPMHAFDLDHLQGGINVRFAKDGESLTILDGKTLELDSESLLITDETGPVALAGIMGGKKTGVSPKTKNVFFESAYFNPLAITGKARQFGLHTDASHRYERGVDFNLQRKAIERASQLVRDICGGSFGPLIESSLPEHLQSDKTVTLRLSRLNRMIGLDFVADDVERVLTDLEFNPRLVAEGEWEITVPSWRFDIAIEADLIEEIARVHGYDNLPENNLSATSRPDKHSESELPESDLVNFMINSGFREIICYSFIDPKIHRLCMGNELAVDLLNPISEDLSVMRTSLMPGLLQAAAYNANRQ